jgi:hypothetical protein
MCAKNIILKMTITHSVGTRTVELCPISVVPFDRVKELAKLSYGQVAIPI